METAESNYGPRGNGTLRDLLNQAGFYLLGIRDLDMAELGYVEVLRRCQEPGTDIGTTHSKLKALEGLMSVAKNRGSYVESEQLCYEALDMSTQELDHNHYYTIGLAEAWSIYCGSNSEMTKHESVPKSIGLTFKLNNSYSSYRKLESVFSSPRCCQYIPYSRNEHDLLASTIAPGLTIATHIDLGLGLPMGCPKLLILISR